MPLICKVTGLNINLNIKQFTPYLTVLIAILLVSKIPTLSLKKMSISQRLQFFIIRNRCSFIALLFYTFLETLLIFGIGYLISIPISIIVYTNQNKKNYDKMSKDNHEDIL